jgi:hypothetical protein
MDVKKLPPPYSKTTFENEVEKEMSAFYNLAEDCYKQILRTHKSLEDYVTDPNISISKNLKKAYNEEDKIWVYYKLTEDLYDTDTQEVQIQLAQFNTDAKALCEETDVNLAGFKKWCKGNAKNFCVSDVKWNTPRKVNGKSSKVHILPKLKPEFIPDHGGDSTSTGIEGVPMTVFGK